MNEVAPDKAKTTWWRRELPLGIPVWVIGLVAVIVGGVFAGKAVGIRIDTTDDDPPSRQVELCESLADPANANLHPSDWRRITDFTQGQLEVYVAARCPEHSFKVLG
jgi:hypothetical protein